MTLIEMIRTFEAEYGLKPSDITEAKDGSIKVTIDKSVLYQYDPGKKNGFQKFWGWLNDSDNSFDPVAHARRVSQQLRDPLVTVSARERYKQLPIPYFSIPIPIKNAGTQVRDYTNLATQKIKISLTFPQNYDARKSLQLLAKASMMSDTLDGSPELPTAARRASWNPIKWLFHAIASCIPQSVAKRINKFLPNKWIKATRPYEWGTRFCDFEVNHGFINSGALAALTVNPVVGMLTGGVGNILCTTNNQPIFGCGYGFQYGDNSNDEKKKNWLPPPSPNINSRTDRFSFFAQTTAKLTRRYADDKAVDTAINLISRPHRLDKTM